MFLLMRKFPLHFLEAMLIRLRNIFAILLQIALHPLIIGLPTLLIVLKTTEVLSGKCPQFPCRPMIIFCAFLVTALRAAMMILIILLASDYFCKLRHLLRPL